jgi:hypothetical protein
LPPLYTARAPDKCTTVTVNKESSIGELLKKCVL